MRRREFITLLGGAAAWSLAAQAQQAVKLHRIGILSPDLPPPGFLEAFRQGLRELGYVEGQNIAFEVRSAEGYGQRLAALANELVRLKVDVIVAINTPSVQAAKKASATIPIVMTRIADPVKSGLVTSLSRPGGNITGLSFLVDELSGKRLALLKEALPSVSRVAVLWYEPNPGADIAVGAIKAASRALGLGLLLLPVNGPADLIGAFQAATRGRVDALVVIEDVVATQHRVEILNLAATHSLAVIGQYKAFADAGALLAYGPSPSAMYRRTAYYVDRILKGATAGDLPVEQPTKFDLVINLKTAKALGVTIPPSLLARADEVIE
jgi:putative ABC transport system substrate-binding protein